MDLVEAIYKRRTIRRFKQETITIKILKKLVDFARLAPMGNNIQSFEYIIISDSEARKNLFPCLAWSASLPPRQRRPEEGRRPMAYIIVLVNTNIKKNPEAEIGAAVQNILLGALNFGLGSCWMGAINGPRIRELFEIPEQFEIKYVISLGYPDEESMVEPFLGSMKYWKDDNGVMHIPKKSLEEVIYKIC